MGAPLYVTYHFPLVAFNILSLSLISVSLITMCLGVFLLGFILSGIFCASWTWLTISSPMLGKFLWGFTLSLHLECTFLLFHCDELCNMVFVSAAIRLCYFLLLLSAL